MNTYISRAFIYSLCWLALAGSLCGLSACSPSLSTQPPADEFHFGTHHFEISGATPEVQQAFDQGLRFTYAFNYEAAEKEFYRAARLQPECAMAWWGIAFVNGPHINFPLVPVPRAERAFQAITTATKFAAHAAPRERALIRALSLRYSANPLAERAPLDLAYAQAMREVWHENRDDADIGNLFAQSMMDLRPWDLWTLNGTPQPGTEEILATLEAVLQINPDHPGANHQYIHAIEASPHPEKGVPAADRLRTLVPGAGHLAHMPAHIYARVGRWQDASAANERAIAADSIYRRDNPRPGFYAVYMAHNHHFLAFSAMMRGQQALALRSARELVEQMPDEFLDAYGPVADGFTIFVSEVLMRFGKWQEILDQPRPRRQLPFAMAMWHFTRASAYVALNRITEARDEQKRLDAAIRKVPEDAFFGNNPARPLLAIAHQVLAGEMAAQQNDFPEAIKHLRNAIMVEDSLRYDEPPDWIQPVRHSLGIVLLRARQYAEAELVYREDLKRWPANGWSLFGLSRALELQGRKAESVEVARQFTEAWKDSDISIRGTCLCQPGV